jgi:hypothetical protein
MDQISAENMPDCSACVHFRDLMPGSYAVFADAFQWIPMDSVATAGTVQPIDAKIGIQ